jgi:hypothetical protein
MWEPVKPSMAVAQESYQVLLELHRQHPEDEDLANQLECARHLRDAIWHEHDAKRRAAL